jgi:hypothetical protein
MIHRILGIVVFAVATIAAYAADPDLISPANRLAPDAVAWRDLAAQFQHHGDVTADFEEQRFFPFRKEPIVLRGEVRVSAAHGLSLHYTAPEERTIVLDDHGVLTREPTGQSAPPPMDPRATVANAALLHVLRFDFAALAGDYELYGRRDGANWSLALVPRAAEVRRALGDMFVSGEADTVRQIKLWRSARQHVDIAVAAPRPEQPFTAEEVGRYFR